MHKFWGLGIVLLFVIGCKQTKPEGEKIGLVEPIEKIPVEKFGIPIDDFQLVQDTIRFGDSFGELMLKNKVPYPSLSNIIENYKDTFDVRKINVGRPYHIFKSKDTTEQLKVFVYENDRINYTVVDFRDSTSVAYTKKKKVKYIEREVAGRIKDNLSVTLDSLGVDYSVTLQLSEIYAWTLDFFRLDEGDEFRVIYDERYINDTLYAGSGSVKAAYFKHKGEPIYAFPYTVDTLKNILDYFDQDANNLRSTFLRAPIKFNYRLSSRYNLRRRIAYYGNRIRPHKGTDYAAAVGTPIIATADGVVTESTRKGGNGKYVKIRHNGTYSTQYLHMRRQKVRQGQFVRQGDIIGWVGMTGNTSGPHVCYRFWKNGSQVDPLREKLPSADPIVDSLRMEYLAHIAPLRFQLDCVPLAPLEHQTEQHIAPNEDGITQNQPNHNRGVEKTVSTLSKKP